MGDMFAQEFQNRRGEVSAGGVACVVRQMLVHDAHKRSIGFK